MTLADFRVTSGVTAWSSDVVIDGLRQVFAPGSVDGRDGWWWAIATLDGVWLAGGWGIGAARDRNMDIARALVRFASARAS